MSLDRWFEAHEPMLGQLFGCRDPVQDVKLGRQTGFRRQAITIAEYGLAQAFFPESEIIHGGTKHSQ